MYKPFLLGFLLAVGACQGTTLRSGSRDGGADAVSATGGITGTGGPPTTGGTTGTGGISASGGTASSRVPTETGGRVGTGGVTGSGGVASPDASADVPQDRGVDVLSVRDVAVTDTAVNSCENPIPLHCGDRLNHSALDCAERRGCGMRVHDRPPGLLGHAWGLRRHRSGVRPTHDRTRRHRSVRRPVLFE